MKIVIASDIHGSAYYCRKLLDAFEREGADRLILLGDILYHGPRNDLPRDYAPKKVIELLSAYRTRIFSVRGNCDTEVDQMVLPFPVLADYAVWPVGEHLMYLTHGHIYNEEKLPPLVKGDILMHGHTHVRALREHEDYTYMNPGSVSIPKEGTPHGYILLEKEKFYFRELED